MSRPSAPTGEGYRGDDWPQVSSQKAWDGKNLYELLQLGVSPLAKCFDVRLLLREVSSRVGVSVADIPQVSAGSNNYVSVISLYVSFILASYFHRDELVPILRWVRYIE